MLEFDGTILVAMISFVVFALVMNKIFYAPLWNIVEERKAFLDDNLSEAKRVKEKAQAILEDKEFKLKNAQKQARETISEGVEKSKNNKSDVINQAVQTSREKIDSEKEKLSQDEQEAKNVLKNNVLDLAKSISEKLLNQEVSQFEYNSDLVDEAMNNV